MIYLPRAARLKQKSVSAVLGMGVILTRGFRVRAWDRVPARQVDHRASNGLVHGSVRGRLSSELALQSLQLPLGIRYESVHKPIPIYAVR